jgi:transcriptional regulator of heat shock response
MWVDPDSYHYLPIVILMAVGAIIGIVLIAANYILGTRARENLKLKKKDSLVELLTRSIEASGLTIIIGSEHPSPDLRAFSLVASTVQDGDRTTTVGVIGPTRMRYQRAISIVDGVSQAVSRVLENQ